MRGVARAPNRFIGHSTAFIGHPNPFIGHTFTFCDGGNVPPVTARRLRRACTRSALGALATGVVGISALFGAAPAIGAPHHTPVTDHCPHRVSTPPAVDTSEVVTPGAVTPTPLPVPAAAVGGSRLSGCGVVADAAAGPVPTRLTSAAWLVADMDSGEIIAAKDPHGRYRPASTIKVLLALTVLDELNLDEVVTPTVEDWSQEGDSCGMGPGGHYTVRDLLNGLLVVSGNDCAHALARTLGGVETTLHKMNELAAQLHALDTRAATPSGLDAAGMSTSPYDLASIFSVAMKNATFREIIAKSSYRFPGYPPRSDVPSDTPHPAYEMQTSNHLLLQGYPGMLGGKTGYTDDALKTFVGAAQRDGRTILVVQMYGLSTSDDNYWTQAQSLLDYGFASPKGTSVGRLVADVTTSAASSSTATTTTAQTGAPTTRSNAAQNDSSSTSHKVLYGLLAALVVVGLIALGARLAGRTR